MTDEQWKDRCLALWSYYRTPIPDNAGGLRLPDRLPGDTATRRSSSGNGPVRPIKVRIVRFWLEEVVHNRSGQRGQVMFADVGADGPRRLQLTGPPLLEPGR